MKTLLIYGAGWTGLVLIAILNGALREKTYGRRLKELTAHQVSTVGAMVFLSVYIWIFYGFFRIRSSGQALAIGAMWLGMTLVFEFGFGRYAMGHSWRKLLNDYNVLKGRVWLLLLTWTAVAPYVAYRIRG